jgi:hypothetical protein
MVGEPGRLEALYNRCKLSLITNVERVGCKYSGDGANRRPSRVAQNLIDSSLIRLAGAYLEGFAGSGGSHFPNCFDSSVAAAVARTVLRG